MLEHFIVGRRGVDSIRYQGRYYGYYNDRLCRYPRGLERSVKSKIPSDLFDYRKWLKKLRSRCKVLHDRLEDFLSVRHYNVGEEPREDGRSGARPQLEFHGNDSLPSYLPYRDHEDEGYLDCIADLDKEAFTVNGSAHMKLYRIPRKGWVSAMVETAHGDLVILRGLVPIGCITDLVSQTEPVSAETLRVYDDLTVKIVKPRHLDHTTRPQYQGPLLSACIFAMFRQSQEDILEEHLLGWDVLDFYFRELVHATLCIASLGKNLSLESCRRILDSPKSGYCDVLSRDLPEDVYERTCKYNASMRVDDSDPQSDLGASTTREHDSDGKNTSAKRAQIGSEDFNAEFVSHFGIGCRIKGNPPGSSSDESSYWFEGVLVVLAVQLNQTGAVAQSVARVFQYHQQNCPLASMNAVIISIEHLILVTISSCGEVQLTEALPLFVLRTHKTKDASSRYPAGYLTALEDHSRHDLAKAELSGRHLAERMSICRKAIGSGTKHRPFWILEEYNPCEFLHTRCGSIAKVSEDLEEIHSRELSEEEDRDPGSLKDIAAKFKKELDESIQPNGDEDSVEETFLSLIQFLEVTARQGLTTDRGRFPAEIYAMIIAHLPDIETHRACMNVSTVFRDLCQHNLRVTNDITLLASGTSSGEHTPDSLAAKYESHSFKILHRPTGVIEHVQLRRAPLWNFPKRKRYYDDDFEVVVGKERDRRSLLPDMRCCFDPVKEKKSTEVEAASDLSDPRSRNVE